MSIESNFLEQFQGDVTITRARYAELIRAEHDANCLKDLILRKANWCDCISADEIQLLRHLYFYPDDESEESEENN